MNRLALALATAAAAALAAFGVVRGTWAVGGSDSSCYGLTALAMASGELQPVVALAPAAPWPDALRTFAPGGFVPSPVRPDAASPICSPGMSLLMAPIAAAFGRDAIFWVVPLAGAILVWSAFAIARQLSGGLAGAAAAMAVATSPIVLFQIVQPMNDVLTASLWVTAIAVGGRPIAAGALTGLAVLVRPNLAPLAVIVAVMPVVCGHERRWRAAAVVIASAAPGILGVAALNTAIYGDPLSSGYGDASRLFAPGNVLQNLSNYSRALLATHYAVPLLGLVAPLMLEGEKRRISLALIGAAAIVTAIYLFYQPYPEWWYLRFLLPALAVMSVLSSVVAVEAATRARMRGAVPVAVLALALLGLRTAGERQAFELRFLEGRYRDTAALIVEKLPRNAVFITVWQSGSVRFHAGRESVMWDSLDPQWLDRAVAWLGAQGWHPYFLLERREESPFRARFRGSSSLGELDWPPRFDLGRQVRIYDPADRARYLAGDTYATENQPRRK